MHKYHIHSYIGSVAERVGHFKRKNNEFEKEVDTLRNIKDRLKKEAKEIHFSVGKFKSVLHDTSI